MRARSTTLYLLPVTGEQSKLAISSSLKCCGRKAKIFSVFPSLNDAYSYTNTATGEEAIALVKMRCKLRWRSPEQTRVSSFFGFANVTNTFHACKRNAVHTSASKEQTLTNIFWTASLQAKKKKSVKQGPSNYRAYCRDSARLGRSAGIAYRASRWTDRQAQPFSRPGRADGRLCSEMNRATSMGNFPSKINAEIAVEKAVWSRSVYGLPGMCQPMTRGFLKSWWGVVCWEVCLWNQCFRWSQVWGREQVETEKNLSYCTVGS